MRPPLDTSPEAHRIQLDVLRRMSDAERMRLALEASDDARELACSGIRARHPDYDASAVEHAVRRLLLGDELYRLAYPGEPLVDP
jgi:hypothetical protein